MRTDDNEQSPRLKLTSTELVDLEDWLIRRIRLHRGWWDTSHYEQLLEIVRRLVCDPEYTIHARHHSVACPR